MSETTDEWLCKCGHGDWEHYGPIEPNDRGGFTHNPTGPCSSNGCPCPAARRTR